ncbi:MAG: CBS domain-containing protein [Gammaproteobacteria bacterium]|nr:CBS domain-containing protein [Gammaproteobacteria bacterium]MDH5735824.1 CBS domain-containing protein [Gammaproteobacteria bacterium]
MTAGEYCNRDVVITSPETSITEAARLMREFHAGDLVVVTRHGNSNTPVGIITDRDIVIEVIARQISPDALTVSEVMSKHPVSVEESVRLLDTVALMQKHGVRRILVVDKKGGLQGILTADDVILLIAESMTSLQQLITRELSQETRIRS